jgi:hypothetical protein
MHINENGAQSPFFISWSFFGILGGFDCPKRPFPIALKTSL